jgi:hypothetical protein
MLRTRTLVALTCVVALSACGDDPTPTPECAAPCFTAPPPTCNGDTAISFQAFGECVEGECQYPPNTPVDCAARDQICVEGACVAAPTPCDDVVCDAPPEPSCESEEARYVYPDVGVCQVVGDEAQCEYEAEAVDCRRSQWCVDGECVARPCFNVTCEEPPARACEGDTIVTYESVGTCNVDTEECEYAVAETVDCAANGQYCFRARCVTPDPCEDVTCDERPENFCDEETLHAFAAGVCSAGECSYVETVTDCEAQGQLCRDGVCRDRFPCEGVVCESAPDPYCSGDELVTFGADGTCADDDCSYPVTRTNCAATGQICLSAQCVDPDPCLGEFCFDRPTPFCEDDVAVGYEVPGVCDDGFCRYTEVRRDCEAEGRVCFAGDCEVLPVCEGVVCNVPPGPVCEGDLAVSFAFPGECIDGECAWTEYVESCAGTGRRCENGLCVSFNPCIGVSCGTLPSPTCDGSIALTWSGTGVCIDGACNHDALRTEQDCAESGLACSNGACVDPGLALGSGSVMVNEIMVTPTGGDPSLQWLEIVALDGYAELEGLVISNAAGDDFALPAGAVAAPYYVVAASEIAVPGGPDAVWPAGFELAVSTETITLTGNGTVDTLNWTSPSWTFATGKSFALDTYGEFVGANDDRAFWCNSPVAMGGGEFGSPGTANGACGGVLAAGAIRVSEIMADGVPRPGGTEQWIELHNTTANTLVIDGLRISTTGGAWAFPTNARFPPGAYIVLGGEPTVGGGPDYLTRDILPIDPAGDFVRVQFAGSVVDVADFSGGTGVGFPYSLGVTMQRTAADGSRPASWCAADAPYEGFATNLGTPGSATVCAE